MALQRKKMMDELKLPDFIDEKEEESLLQTFSKVQKGKCYPDSVKKTNKQIEDELGIVFKPIQEEDPLLRFMKFNPEVRIVDGVVVEKNVHQTEEEFVEKSEEYCMPSVNTLFHDN